MAHDFSIKKISTQETAYFFGYGGGALYKAFACERFNNGMSGSGGGVEVAQPFCVEALKKAIDLLGEYPDSERADGLKEFLENVAFNSSEDEKFFARFS